MNCPSCGHENRADSRFCLGCGAKLAVACSGCGRELPPGARFCDGCGADLGEAPTVPPARAPRAYTPKHLADKILQSKSALEGERKQVTVLFADIKGSMDLAEQVDPEEWHRILNRFFEILTDGVHRFEGTVNQYTGDGIMALFGAPITHEDHAQRACYAALHLQGGLRRYADELRLSQGLNFSVRMGLNSGEVVVGKIGDDLRMDYTAQGQTVNLAARMEQLAEPGRVYITEHTARLVEGFFELRDLGPLDVKGAGGRVGVSVLEGVGAMRTRLEVSRSRGFSRFVGRADEIATLEGAFSRTLEGNGQVAGVVGEAGVGKSRLCREFIDRRRARGTAVYEAHCPSYGTVVPFLPLLELLRNLFGITERDSEHEARRKIAGELTLLGEAFREILPLVFEFLGVPDPGSPAPRMEAEARQRQLFAFVRRLIQARSDREPTVLLVDDLHWVDPGSDGFLAQIVEAVEGTRTLLVVNFRPEYNADWTRKSYYQQLALATLGPEAIRELLDDLLGRDPSLSGLAAVIHARTGGNPFFAEEVVQALIDSGQLEGERGHYGLVTSVEELGVPPTVQAVLAARIDRLPEREKQVLQTAAVIGKEFSEPILDAVLELPQADLAATLAALTQAEFVREHVLYPVAEYAFKHPLTQLVAYESQLSERRSRIHAAVARMIEEREAARLDEQAGVLAYHWEEAGERTLAARWCERAARVVSLTDLPQAVTHWQRVIDLLACAEESREAAELGVEARIQLLNVGVVADLSPEAARGAFAEGIQLVTRLNDDRRATLLDAAFIHFLTWTDQIAEAGERVPHMLSVVERSEDVELKLGTVHPLVGVLYSAGKIEEALRVVEAREPLVGDDPDLGSEFSLMSPLCSLRAWRVQLLSHSGRLDEAKEALGILLELSRRHGETSTLIWQAMQYGDIAAFSGERVSIERITQASELAEKVGGTYWRAMTEMGLGSAYKTNGDPEAARSRLESSHELLREIRSWYQCTVLAFLGEVYSELGDRRRGSDMAEEGVELARRSGTRLGEEWCLLSLARVLRSSEGAGSRQAARAIERGLTLADETGFRVLMPQFLVERAELARLRGDDAALKRELREAHRLFTEMGATGHAERLARELGP